MANPGDPSNRLLVNKVAEEGGWTSNILQTFTRFNIFLEQSDAHIIPDLQLEQELLAKAELGDLSMGEAQLTYNNSHAGGEGITRAALTRITSSIKDSAGANSAFAINLGLITGLKIDDFKLLQLPGGFDLVTQKKDILNKMEGLFRESISIFRRLHPDKGPASAEAFEFYQQVKDDVINASSLGPVLNPDFKPVGEPPNIQAIEQNEEIKQGAIEGINERRKVLAIRRLKGSN